MERWNIITNNFNSNIFPQYPDNQRDPDENITLKYLALSIALVVRKRYITPELRQYHRFLRYNGGIQGAMCNTFLQVYFLTGFATYQKL